MKKIVILFSLILSHQLVMSQNKDNTVTVDVQTLLQEGTYSLKLVNMVAKEDKVEDSNVLYVDPETGVIEMENPQLQSSPEGASPVLELQTTGFVQYKISQEDQIIRIEPVENKNMPSVTIDLATNVVKVEDQKLSFDKKLQVTGNENIFRNAWNGYRWNFESNSPGSAAYRFTIGKIEKTGQLYLEILGQDAQKHRKKAFYHFRFLT